jgi:SsrA-binding protein
MEKIVVKNRKAWHDYHILERFEAGISLQGSEVKAIREGKISLTDAYCDFIEGELFLVEMNISQYSHHGYATHEQRRARKLLLHRRELDRLEKKREGSGLTIIPLSVYWVKNHLKIEIGLAQGKKQHDKRAAIAERETKRSLDQEMKRRR